MSSFIVRRMAFFNSARQKSGWYHNMIPTTFRCSSFRNQVVCPLPAYPVSTHAPDFVAIFVHIRGILAVIRPLVWYPAKARNIDLIAGLQLYGRLRRGRRRAPGCGVSTAGVGSAGAGTGTAPSSSSGSARGVSVFFFSAVVTTSAFGAAAACVGIGAVVPLLCLAAATQRRTGPSKR